MSERILARLILAFLAAVFLVTGWLIHVRPANGIILAESGERVRLLVLYAEVALVAVFIIGGLAGLFGLALLIAWCLKAGWE